VNIKKVTGAKKEYIDLLLLADEQESMIDKYLERGEMFVLDDNGIKAECVITKEADGIYELKNIAVLPECQRKGYGKSLIEFLSAYYSDCNVMYVGTGDCHSALAFYNSCGFTESHRIKNFFIDNYNHPMFEDGKQLIDMVYLKRNLKQEKYMSELTSMKNIGKEMAKKLTTVGIASSEKLIEVGAKQAFLHLKETYPQVCLVHLYTLEGAIQNIEFNCLSEDKKRELKEFSDFLKM